jgi:hypothetical protein
MRSPSAHAPYAASASAERALTGSLLAPSWSPRAFGAGAAASGDDSVGRIGGRVARLGVGGAGADVAIVVCRSDAASFLRQRPNPRAWREYQALLQRSLQQRCSAGHRLRQVPSQAAQKSQCEVNKERKKIRAMVAACASRRFMKSSMVLNAWSRTTLWAH